MHISSNDNFGPLVAYLVPGATALWGLTPHSATLRSWATTAPADAPTIGGFLYLSLAALAVGMALSAVRWAALDRVLHRLGAGTPPRDFSRLGAHVAAFSLLIEIHYRHYLFFGNMVVATAVAYAGIRLGPAAPPPGWIDLGVLLLEGIFLAAARDTLRKYNDRGRQLLEPRGRRR